MYRSDVEGLLGRAHQVALTTGDDQLVERCMTVFGVRDALFGAPDAPEPDRTEQARELIGRLEELIDGIVHEINALARDVGTRAEAVRAHGETILPPRTFATAPVSDEDQALHRELSARLERGEQLSTADLDRVSLIGMRMSTELLGRSLAKADATMASTTRAAATILTAELTTHQHEVNRARHVVAALRTRFNRQARLRSLVKAAIVGVTFLVPFLAILLFHGWADELIHELLPESWPAYWPAFVLIALVMLPVELIRSVTDRRIDGFLERRAIADVQHGCEDAVKAAVDALIALSQARHDRVSTTLNKITP